MENQTDSTYRTSDFATIAYLIAKGCTVFKLEPGRDRTHFHFLNPTRCKELHIEFVNGTGKIVARDYSDAMRRAKDLLKANESAA